MPTRYWFVARATFALCLTPLVVSAADFVDIRSPAGPAGRKVVVSSSAAQSEQPAVRSQADREIEARAAIASVDGASLYPGAPLEWNLIGQSGGPAEHFFFQGEWDGVEVFDAARTAHLLPRRTLVQYSEGGMIRPPSATTWTLTAAQARTRLGQRLGGPSLEVQRERKIWFPLADGLRPAWELVVHTASGSFQSLIDADDGRLLYLFPLTRDTDPVGRVFEAPHVAHPGEGSSTLVNWKGYPASAVCPSDVYPAAFVSGASAGECWTDGVTTTGNNADACLDLSGNNTCSSRPSGAVFDFAFTDAYSTSGNPVPDRDAAVANAFYWTNVIHDWLYRLGFDEPSGAFQDDNFGRGGYDGDRVRVDVQDSSNSNNASFSTPPDGIPPRMQLGLFTGSWRDSAFDADVLIHEYVHGLTNRLIGGPNTVSGLFLWQSGAMGEGWSDSYGVALTDDPLFGEYVTRNNSTGIRRVRYDQSGLTYGRFGVRSGAVVPNTSTVLTLPQVHTDGEIWASTLWDLYATLGSSVWGPLVTEGLKLTPMRPSMLDARDAILDAADALSADECAAWAVFANRGMGYSAAINPIESTHANDTALSVYEAFDMPPACGGSAPGFSTTLFLDDAETNVGWTATGQWHRTTRRAASGSQSWWFGQEGSGDYDTGARANGDLISPVIDLTEVDDARLEWTQFFRGPGFYHRVDFGSFWAPYLNQDSGRVWISTNGGASWQALTHIAHNSPGSGFVDFKINLSRFVGNAVRIKFDFDTFSNADNDYEGWFIDDIRIATSAVSDPPVLSVSPASLVFSAQQGGLNPLAQSVTVTNLGGAGLSWTAAATLGAPWLSVTPSSGSEGGVLSIGVNIAALTAGAYVGNVRVDAGSAGISDIPVSLTLSAPAGPIAQWSFDETGSGSGVTLSDAASAHPLTTAGAGASRIGGVSGGARLLNGYTDSASASGSLSLTPTRFTFLTWVKLHEAPSNVGIVASAFGGGNYRGWYLALNSNRQLIFMAAKPPSSAPWLVSSAQVPLGQWARLAVSFDGLTNAGRIYLNGAAVANATFPGLTADNTAPFTLGKASWADTWRLHGALDEAQILPRVLTPAEITADYSSVSPPAATSNLFTGGEWSFDGHLLDESGNDHDGAATGGEFVPGVVGQARRFDGVNDFVTIPNDELLNPADMTVRAWVRLQQNPSAMGVIASNYNADYEGWYIGVLPSGKVFLGLASKPSSLPSVVSSVGLGEGVWRHLTAVYEGRIRRMSLYLDGQLVDQTYASGMTPHTSGSFLLGRASWTNFHYTAFDIDELQIEPQAWTPSEVSSDFSGFTPPTPAEAVASWDFEETAAGDGTAFADSSGNAHTLTAAGAGNAPQTGVSGAARFFTGWGGHASAPADSDFSSQSFSFSTWLRLDQFPYNWGAVFSTYDGAHRGWYLGVRSDGSLILCVAGQPSSSPWLVTSQTLNLGEWHHVAVTFEGGSRRGLIYLDGVRVASAVFPAWTPQTGVSPTFAKASWGSTGYLPVWLDQARLFDYERDAAAIAAEHSAGAARQTPSPIAAWSFDETEIGSVVLNDSVGSADILTLDVGGVPDIGVDGGARRFMGMVDRTLVAGSFGSSSFSWTGYVRVDSFPSGFGVIFADHSGASSGWHGSVNADGRLILAVSGQPSSNPWLVSTATVTVGQWHHIAFTLDGVARRGAIYLDGVRVASAVFPAWTPQAGIPPTFGQASWIENYFLPVTLDRVRLYDVELSAQEVAGDL